MGALEKIYEVDDTGGELVLRVSSEVGASRVNIEIRIPKDMVEGAYELYRAGSEPVYTVTDRRIEVR